MKLRVLATCLYVADQSSSSVEPVQKLYPGVEEHANGNEKVGVNPSPNPDVDGKKNTAKIHDFCFGIPFGESVWTFQILEFLRHRWTCCIL